MTLYIVFSQTSFVILCSSHGTFIKWLQLVCDGSRNKLQSRCCYWADILTANHIFSTLQHKICCSVKYLIFPQKIELSVFSIQGPLLSNKIMWHILNALLTSTHEHHVISMQYPSHVCLPEKSCPNRFRILIVSWFFQDPVVITKEIMSWLFKDPILTVVWINFDIVRKGISAPPLLKASTPWRSSHHF